MCLTKLKTKKKKNKYQGVRDIKLLSEVLKLVFPLEKPDEGCTYIVHMAIVTGTSFFLFLHTMCLMLDYADKYIKKNQGT